MVVDRDDAPAALRDIILKKITVYVGVPTMHIAMLNLFSNSDARGLGR